MLSNTQRYLIAKWLKISDYLTLYKAVLLPDDPQLIERLLYQLSSLKVNVKLSVVDESGLPKHLWMKTAPCYTDAQYCYDFFKRNLVLFCGVD